MKSFFILLTIVMCAGVQHAQGQCPLQLELRNDSLIHVTYKTPVWNINDCWDYNLIRADVKQYSYWAHYRQCGFYILTNSGYLYHYDFVIDSNVTRYFKNHEGVGVIQYYDGTQKKYPFRW